MAIIECKGLTKKFGKKIALDEVGFQIEEQGITGLIGRNGSGKTTFMKIASGVLQATSGDIEVMACMPYGDIQVAKDVIYSIHNYPHMEKHPLKNIQSFYKKLYPKFDDEFATKLMKYYKLDGKMRYVELSQGMKSMFNFSMALATRCSVTFLDEPMLGMDAKTRKHAYEILLTEYTLYPRNFVISSHMLNEFDGILSDIVLIDDGRLIFHKDLEEVSQMAFRIDGEESILKEMTSTYEVLYEYRGEVQSYSVVAGKLTEEIKCECEKQKLVCSTLRPEDVCIYYSSQKNEENLSCLWNEKN